MYNLSPLLIRASPRHLNSSRESFKPQSPLQPSYHHCTGFPNFHQMGPKEAESFPLIPRDPMAPVPEHQPQSGKGNQHLSQSPPLNVTEPSETGATVDSQLESHLSFSRRGIFSDSHSFPGGPAIHVSDHDVNDGQGEGGSPGTGAQKREHMPVSEYGGSVISVYDMGISVIANDTTRPPIRPGRVIRAQELRALFQLKDLDPGSESTVERAMSDKIQASLIKPNQTNADDQYLPIDAFENILNLNAITSLLHEKFKNIADDELQQKLEQIIGPDGMGSRKRILGILLCIELFHTIDNFIEENICDLDFPLTRATESKAFMTKRHPNKTNTTLLRSWRWRDIESLYSFQRKLFVPFFNIEKGKVYSSELSVILLGSIINYSKAPDKKTIFALKEIKTEHELRDHQEDFRNELRALEKCHSMVQKEKHLIKLLLAFQHGEKYYLLFEWAEGNLKELWERRTVIHSPSAERWAAQQCHGISTAIKRIHGVTSGEMENDEAPALSPNAEGDKRYGRHGDIKPQNILWFTNPEDDKALLVVSDLGLTRYHSHLSRSAVYRVDGFTSTYYPPELAMKRRLGQGYDIWSLGCVYLEFCTWYLEGVEAVEAFELKRLNDDMSLLRGVKEDKYFNITRSYEWGSEHNNGRPVVKEVVQKWIDRLINLDSGTAFTQQLLHLIKTQMLIVDPTERARIGQVCTELATIKDSLQGSKVGEETTEEPIFQDRTDPDKTQSVSDQQQNQTLSERDKGILVSHAVGGMSRAIDKESPFMNRNQRPRSTTESIKAHGSQSQNSLDLESQGPTTQNPLDNIDDTGRSDTRPTPVPVENRPTSTTNYDRTKGEAESTSGDGVRPPAVNNTSVQGVDHQPAEVPEMLGVLSRVMHWVKGCWKAITEAFQVVRLNLMSKYKARARLN
ncbi:hypothetical protein EDB80DRAFT_677438 [Ilyonectria destructans]|nr:hypothetical protein EDB80DRAFT_677438 [Ilyonectria destructans]